MKHRFFTLANEPLFVKTSLLCLLFIALSIALAAFKWASFPPELPLFYSYPRGEEQLGTAWQLLLLPAISFVFFIINSFLALHFIEKERLISVVLSLMSLIVSLLLFITFLKIIFLVS